MDRDRGYSAHYEMKDISGYDGLYAVTEDGRVWSYRANRFLKPKKDHGGYLNVSLWNCNKQKMFKVHRLVANAYLPNPDNLPQVNHIDEDKTNNSISNLEWCNQKYNNNYGTRIERIAKLKSKQVYCIELDRVFDSVTIAADELGLCKQHVSKCCTGISKTTGGYHFRFV